MAELKTHKSRIGKGLINMLMFQMYGDEKLIYREYVQNARDAINDAVNHGILGAITDGRISITIDSAKRFIEIRDNGIGIPVERVESVLLDIADSNKDGESSAGQFGIGRLVGGYFCKKLSFRTTYKGEEFASEIVFDIDKIKAILNDENDKRDATDVIDSASSRNLYDENKDDHYFIVTLCNIDLQYPALLNKDIIADYLREVAPVDYSAQFRNQLIMTSVSGEYEELQKNVGYFPISINGTAIEKRYGLRVVGTNDTINGLEYFSLKDDTYGLLAWGWYALTDFTKAIPVSDTSSQFRLRKHNIQVGEADMLTTYFPRNETRGNKYFYGEIHIANQKIKLNSARDGLAPTPEAECLKCLIRNFFDGLVKLYHLANDTKKAVERYIDAYKIIQAPATENIVNAQKQLTDACKKLKSITKSKNATNPVAQKVLESYKRRIKDLHTEMDQEIPCIPASELPISSPIPQVEPELDDFEILNNHYPEDLAALIRRVCMSYQRNCPVSHIKLDTELQRKAIRELIEE